MTMRFELDTQNDGGVTFFIMLLHIFNHIVVSTKDIKIIFMSY